MINNRMMPLLAIICSCYILSAQEIKFEDAGIVARLEKYFYYYVSQTVTDWNTDGKTDIITGFITDPILMQFMENTGTVNTPAFQKPVSIAIPSS